MVFSTFTETTAGIAFLATSTNALDVSRNVAIPLSAKTAGGIAAIAKIIRPNTVIFAFDHSLELIFHAFL
jgi:hypothetical protein